MRGFLVLSASSVVMESVYLYQMGPIVVTAKDALVVSVDIHAAV